MKIDLNELRKRKIYIGCQKHATLDLLVWNYTHKCQHEKAWDEFTMVARGLITDLEGNIISRPLKKFFNLSEHEETSGENLVHLGEPKIYEKLDGSLGIQYYDGDIPQIATRGSFTSDQAKWASAWLESRFTKNDFLEGYTYLYEIIYPENRIVVDYNDRQELVLLAVIETETGAEIDYIAEAKKLGLSYAAPFEKSFKELEEYVKKMKSDEEGFVLLYPNRLRVKMKGEEYCRLHKIISACSTRTVWEQLVKTGNTYELQNLLPIQFHNWIHQTERKLRDKFYYIEGEVDELYEKIDLAGTRKEQALFILENGKAIAPILFAILDDKPSGILIWKMIKPKYSKPMLDAEQMDADFVYENAIDEITHI